MRFHIRTFHKMADETDKKIGENDEKTTFKDLVSAKLKCFYYTFVNYLIVWLWLMFLCVVFHRELPRFSVKRARKSVGKYQRKSSVNAYLWHCKVGIEYLMG